MEKEACVAPLFSDLGFSLLPENCMFSLNILWGYCTGVLPHLTEVERTRIPTEVVPLTKAISYPRCSWLYFNLLYIGS